MILVGFTQQTASEGEEDGEIECGGIRERRLYLAVSANSWKDLAETRR